MHRREFIRICAASAAAQTILLEAAAASRPRFYSRALLVNSAGQPLHAAKLAIGRNYVFSYPYRSTPCFLLNLGRPTIADIVLKTESGGSYTWPGGAGSGRSIVAYSAICAHRMTYPTRQISFISYREAPAVAGQGRANVIHCCSEHSEYDPAQGGRVVGGPAPQPLAAIILEHSAAADTLYAVGTLGGEMFEQFFAKFEFQLALEHGATRAHEAVAGQTPAVELEQFCKQQVKC